MVILLVSAYFTILLWSCELVLTIQSQLRSVTKCNCNISHDGVTFHVLWGVDCRVNVTQFVAIFVTSIT